MEQPDNQMLIKTILSVQHRIVNQPMHNPERFNCSGEFGGCTLPGEIGSGIEASALRYE